MANYSTDGDMFVGKDMVQVGGRLMRNDGKSYRKCEHCKGEKGWEIINDITTHLGCGNDQSN